MQDREFLEEKEKNVSNIVKISSATTKKKKQASRKKSIDNNLVEEEPIMCSKYLEKVKLKRGRNKKKMQELGLLEKTPTPKRLKPTTKPNSPKGRGTAACRKIMQSPKNKTVKSRNKQCPYDHKCYSTSYKEETDRRYLGSDFDLFGVKCQGCNKKFSNEVEKNCIAPSFSAPMYVCHGRGKHECTHSICYQCYQELFMKHSSTRRSRTKR